MTAQDVHQNRDGGGPAAAGGRDPAGRIVIFVPSIMAFGGVERLVVDLSRFLHHQGLPHTILCLNLTIDMAAHADWPMDIHPLNPRRDPFAEGRAVARYFRETGFGRRRAPLFFDIKGAFYGGLFDYPAFNLHLTDPPSLLPRDRSKCAPSARHARGSERADLATSAKAEIVHQINRRGVRRARRLLAMTNVIAEELKDRYGRDAMVIPPGVPALPAAAARPGDEPGPLRLLSVSRLEDNKRIDWILRALASLEAGPDPLSVTHDWALDIVGDGAARQPLHNLAASLGLGERVLFHGRVSDAELEGLFAGSSLFLMPAVQGYGLPALEALTRGKPVILHRDSGVSEVLGSTPWTEVITDGEADLAKAIRRMSDRIAAGELAEAPIPDFPTSDVWARNIAQACGWL